MFAAKVLRRKSWWLSFLSLWLKWEVIFLGDGYRSGGPGSPTLPLFPPPVGCESKAPFPSGSSFSPLDSSLPEDVPVFTAASAATPLQSAVPARYFVSPDCLRGVGRGPGSWSPALGPRIVRREEV